VEPLERVKCWRREWCWDYRKFGEYRKVIGWRTVGESSRFLSNNRNCSILSHHLEEIDNKHILFLFKWIIQNLNMPFDTVYFASSGLNQLSFVFWWCHWLWLLYSVPVGTARWHKLVCSLTRPLDDLTMLRRVKCKRDAHLIRCTMTMGHFIFHWDQSLKL